MTSPWGAISMNTTQYFGGMDWSVYLPERGAPLCVRINGRPIALRSFWRVRPARTAGQVIHFQFRSIATEAGADCITLYDGPDASSPALSSASLRLQPSRIVRAFTLFHGCFLVHTRVLTLRLSFPLRSTCSRFFARHEPSLLLRASRTKGHAFLCFVMSDRAHTAALCFTGGTLACPTAGAIATDATLSCTADVCTVRFTAHSDCTRKGLGFSLVWSTNGLHA